MKKLVALLLILLILMASVPVFGVSDVLPDVTEKETSYVDSTWINFDPEYTIWMVILTSYQDRADIKYDISSIIKRQIEKDLSEAFDNASEILSKFNSGNVKYILKSLFDVTVTDTEVKLIETKPEICLRLRVDVGLSEGEKPFVAHKLENSGEWVMLDENRYWVNGDNTLTLCLDSFCPVMVLLSAEAGPDEIVVKPEEAKPESAAIEDVVQPAQDFEQNENADFIIGFIIGLSIVGLAIAAYVLHMVETKKNNSRVLFALQRIKLNIEIAIARRRAR